MQALFGEKQHYSVPSAHQHSNQHSNPSKNATSHTATQHTDSRFGSNHFGSNHFGARVFLGRIDHATLGQVFRPTLGRIFLKNFFAILGQGILRLSNFLEENNSFSNHMFHIWWPPLASPPLVYFRDVAACGGLCKFMIDVCDLS